MYRGATHSNLVICDETGTVRGKSKGPGTNHWAVGIEECANRVVNMVNAAKEDAGIPKDRPLDSLVSVNDKTMLFNLLEFKILQSTLMRIMHMHGA